MTPTDRKFLHKAMFISADGDVSALCSEKSPSKINMKEASWTLTWAFVTCQKCLALRGLSKPP